MAGFPEVSYRDFIAPVALFTAVFFLRRQPGDRAGARHLRGYFKKLMIMPINRLSIILGRLTEVAVQAVFQGPHRLVLLLSSA